jgi:acetyltransferase-like isoleucine patch superfamily enzyme
VQISHTARLVNRGRREAVAIGAHSVVRGIVRNEPSGSIAIGAEVYVGDGTLISAAESVIIGDQTLLAHGVQIFDNASHPFDADERAEHFRMMLGLASKRPVRIPSNPVSIGRNCWICTNAIILPGSRIGDRAIVSAGSVVKGEVPPDVVYGAAAAAGGEPVPTRREPVGRP